MQIARHDDARAILLVVEGEVDLMTAPRLHAALLAALRDGPRRVVILDLTRVSLLSSAGLNAMWEARRKHTSAGRPEREGGGPAARGTVGRAAARGRRPRPSRGAAAGDHRTRPL